MDSAFRDFGGSLADPSAADILDPSAKLFPPLLFWGTRGSIRAPVAIVGEAWGEREDVEKRPFVGASGFKLDQILDIVGIPRSQCFFTNLIPARPPHNDILQFFYSNAEAKALRLEKTRGLYPKAEMIEGLQRLRHQLRYVKPKLIISLGNYPLWGLTDNEFSISLDKTFRTHFAPSGIAIRRGSQTHTSILYGHYPLVPTYHPAAALRQPELFRLIITDLQLRAKPYIVIPAEPPAYRFILRPTFFEAVSTLQMLIERADFLASRNNFLRLGSDLETRRGMIACHGLSWSATEAICIPFMCVEKPRGYWTEEEEFVITRLLSRLLRHPAVRVVGQNYLYDMQYIALYNGFLPNIYMDTMWAWHLLNPNDQRSLNYLSSIFNKYHRYWKDEGKEWDESMPEEQLWRYNCIDCCATLEASVSIDQWIDKREQRSNFNFQMEQFHLALSMMLKGTRVDDTTRRRMMLEVEFALRDRELWLETIIPNWKPKASFWHSSPSQQKELFYETLGLPKQYKRKGVKRGEAPGLSIDDDALDRLIKVEPLFKPIFQTLREIRSLRKFLDTPYALSPDPDGRIRCFFCIGPETFRWMSRENAFGSGTNLQNISKGNEDYVNA